MEIKNNKVHFGIKNVHYALVTETTTTAGTSTTYGSPVAMPGAVSIDLSANQETTEFYADDGVYYITQNDATYEGDLTIADIPDQFKKDVFGDKEDSNGVLVETTGNPVKYFALMFETKGDAGGHRTLFYKCSATRPNASGQTKEETTEVQPMTLSIKAIPRVDLDTVGGETKRLTQANVKEGASAYANFFQAVYEPTFT